MVWQMLGSAGKDVEGWRAFRVLSMAIRSGRLH